MEQYVPIVHGDRDHWLTKLEGTFDDDTSIELYGHLDATSSTKPEVLTWLLIPASNPPEWLSTPER